MMNRKIFFTSLGFLGMVSISNAQVGIGNATPNAGSILDLTNSSDKALLLPTSTIVPSSVGTFTTAGMLFYYQDKLFLRTSTGTNVLSPWIFDGTSANGIYVASGTPVGIGIAPLVSSTAVLTIADASGEVTVSTSTASVVIGDNDFNAAHMLIDKDEILVKTNATTAGILKLQEDGGTIEVRSSTADAGVTTVFTAYGSVDAKGKVKENGNDLLPVGAIIMWNGTTVPSGWALCDGGSYALMDGSGNVSTPNLMDKFIIGADATGGNGAAVGTYAYGNAGGGTTHTLSAANIPSHQHEAGANSATMNITSSGSHNHKIDVNDGAGSGGNYIEFDSNEGDEGDLYTATDGSHTHPNGNFSGVTGLGVGLGGASTTITHGLPPYYALAFIMKL